jgi:hypothetical protein
MLWNYAQLYNPEVYFWLLESEEIDKEVKHAA